MRNAKLNGVRIDFIFSASKRVSTDIDKVVSRLEINKIYHIVSSSGFTKKLSSECHTAK